MWFNGFLCWLIIFVQGVRVSMYCIFKTLVCTCVHMQAEAESKWMLKREQVGLLDELVSSLVGFVDTCFVHVRLRERDRERETVQTPGERWMNTSTFPSLSATVALP